MPQNRIDSKKLYRTRYAVDWKFPWKLQRKLYLREFEELLQWYTCTGPALTQLDWLHSIKPHPLLQNEIFFLFFKTKQYNALWYIRVHSRWGLWGVPPHYPFCKKFPPCSFLILIEHTIGLSGLFQCEKKDRKNRPWQNGILSILSTFSYLML